MENGVGIVNCKAESAAGNGESALGLDRLSGHPIVATSPWSPRLGAGVRPPGPRAGLQPLMLGRNDDQGLALWRFPSSERTTKPRRADQSGRSPDS